MSFIITALFVMASSAFLTALLAYRLRYIQNAALYLPQMPPDSRTNCPNPSAAQGFQHYELLSVPTRDGITLRGYVVRPAAVSDAARQRARAGVGRSLLLGAGAAGSGGGGGGSNSSNGGINLAHLSSLVNSGSSGGANNNVSQRSLSSGGGANAATTTNTLATAVGSGSGTVAINIPPPGRAVAGGMSGNASDAGDAADAHTGLAASSSPNSPPPPLPTLPAPDTSDTEKGVIVYFHGNAGNVGHRLPIAYHLAKATGCAVVMIDYRGYGRSDDPPTGFTKYGGLFVRRSNGPGGAAVASATFNPNSALNSRAPAGPPTAAVRMGGQGNNPNNHSDDEDDGGGGGGLSMQQIKKLLAEAADRGVTEEGLQTDAEAVMDYVLNRNVSASYPHYRRGLNIGGGGGGTSGGGADVMMGSTHAQTTTTAVATTAVGSSGFASASGKVFVMGTSLGGAVTAYISSHDAYKDSVSGVILENTFMSISEMVDEIATKMFCRRSGGGGATSSVLGATEANTAPVGGTTAASSSQSPTPGSPTPALASTTNRNVPANSQQQQQQQGTAVAAIATSAVTHGSCLNNAILFILLRILKPLVLFLGWNSGDRVAELAAPILFLSGRRDEIVPPRQMDRLRAAAVRTQWKRFAEFPDGMHNDLAAKQGYFTAIADFIDSVVSPRPSPQ